MCGPRKNNFKKSLWKIFFDGDRSFRPYGIYIAFLNQTTLFSRSFRIQSLVMIGQKLRLLGVTQIFEGMPFRSYGIYMDLPCLMMIGMELRFLEVIKILEEKSFSSYGIYIVHLRTCSSFLGTVFMQGTLLESILTQK